MAEDDPLAALEAEARAEIEEADKRAREIVRGNSLCAASAAA
jgi:hypothetical protein